MYMFYEEFKNAIIINLTLHHAILTRCVKHTLFVLQNHRVNSE